MMYILSVRANGELIDNSQAEVIMKMTLFIIWMSVILKSILSLPFFNFVVGSENDQIVEKESIHLVQTKKDELYVNMKKYQLSFQTLFDKLMSFIPKDSDSINEAENENLIIV